MMITHDTLSLGSVPKNHEGYVMEITNLKTGKSYRKKLNPVMSSADSDVLPDSDAPVPVDLEFLGIDVASLQTTESLIKDEDSEDSDLMNSKISHAGDESDDHIHSGHYHSFYKEDDTRAYVQKVLITSGAAYVMNSALHNILDGFIWDWFGLPVITVVLPFLTKFILSVPSTMNPFKLFRMFWNNLFSKKSSSRKHHGHDHGNDKKLLHKGNSELEKLFFHPRNDNKLFLPKNSENNNKLFGIFNIDRRKMTRAVRFGFLAWLIVRLISPLSSSLQSSSSINFPIDIQSQNNNLIRESDRNNELQNVFISTKTSRNSDKKNINKNPGSMINLGNGKFENSEIKASNPFGKVKPLKILKEIRKKLNPLEKINGVWQHSKLRKIIAARINSKKRELGVPHCPLRFLIEETSSQ